MASTAGQSNDGLFKSKQQTYSGFTRLVFWGSLSVIVILAVMAAFLL